MDNRPHEVLILGLGNPLRADDGLGEQVIRSLKQRKWPSRVTFLEAGTSLFYYLEEISRSRLLIIVDAVRGGSRPGSVYRLDLNHIDRLAGSGHNAHSFALPHVVALAREIRGLPARVVIFGIEPGDLDFDCRLSVEVRGMLPEIIEAISREINRLL